MPSTQINRRTFAAAAAALVCTPILSLRTVAQDATPAAGVFDDLGLPRLDVTISAMAIEGIPETLAAGRYLVSLTADQPFTELDFQQPVGMTMDEFQDAIVQYQAQSAASSTPSADGEGGDEDSGPPAFFYDFLIAGGVGQSASGTGEAVIDLPPGDWMAWAGSPDAPQPPVVFTATGEMTSDLVEPAATATITLSSFAINVTAGSLVSGTNLLRIDNSSDQPHFLDLQKGPDGMTRDQVEAALQADMSGTPVTGGLNPNTDFTPFVSTSTQSGGTSTWISAELEPGSYAAFCWFPDKDTGMPHAYMGMFNVFTVDA